MLIIIKEASRRIPHMAISADAQDEQYQLGGDSEKNTSQVCATSLYQDGFVLGFMLDGQKLRCADNWLLFNHAGPSQASLDGQTKSFTHEGHSSQALLPAIGIDGSSSIRSFIHSIVLDRITFEHRQ
jgi:hypothetical protein